MTPKQPRTRGKKDKQTASSTPVSLDFVKPAPVDGEAGDGTRTSTDTEMGMGMDMETEKMIRQRHEHECGAHIGRDPYGLASKPYLDAGLPPPWERCELCEEEMVWLRREAGG